MKNISNALLGISLIVILILTMLLMQKPKEVEKIVYKEKECTEMTKLNVAKNENYVLLGDSITDWYPVSEYFDDTIPVVRSGKAGFQTKDILERVEDMVIKYNPTKVFILIGTNDLEGVHKEQILENIESIIKTIKQERPKAEIYFESILPVNNTDASKIKPATVGNRDNDYIVTVNKEIKEICKKQKVNYLDVYKEFVDDNNQMKLNYTADGLHLSELGYYKLTQILLKNM